MTGGGVPGHPLDGAPPGFGEDGAATGLTIGGGPPPNLMIVGDSISQGREGDHTWRYRFWRHLSELGIAARFVGPWAGTWVPSAVQPRGHPAPPDAPAHAGRYRQGIEFAASRHYASWGRLLHEAKDNIADAVADHEADCLLVALGFNDLAWGVSDPGRLLVAAETFIDRARDANPDVQFVFADVVHRTPLADRPRLAGDTVEYNRALAARLPMLSTARSRVEPAGLCDVYDPHDDAYDGVHPNGRGEIKIAQVFGGVFSSVFGDGPPARAGRVPAPRRSGR